MEIAGSSSSPAGSSSPFAFPNTRLDAYNAPSSPLPPTKSSASPTILVGLADLPPVAQPVFVAAAHPLGNNKARSSGPAPSPDRLSIRLEAGVRFQFGRKAKKSYLEPSSNKTVPILLPHSAKNASRLHCTAQLALPLAKGDKATLQVRVLGQNGMKIDGKLWDKGSVALLEVDDAQRVELAFWGWSAFVVAPGEKRKAPIQVVMRERVEKRQARPPTPVLVSATPARPTVVVSASSPDSLFDGSDSELVDSFSPVEDAFSHPPSPALSALSALSSSPAPEQQWADDADEASSREMSTRAAALASSLALDLPGLIASAIVFHPRSTVGVREVVEALLREVGGMWDVVGGKVDDAHEKEAEDEAVDAWWEVVETVLQEEPFFGCIANAGLRVSCFAPPFAVQTDADCLMSFPQDAAGNPLPPAYYYLPDLDPSKSRVEALEPFVKRVRGARLEGGGTFPVFAALDFRSSDTTIQLSQESGTSGAGHVLKRTDENPVGLTVADPQMYQCFATVH